MVGPGNRLLINGIWSYSYDAEGNLVGKTHLVTGDRWSYRYDHRNQMTWPRAGRDRGGGAVRRVQVRRVWQPHRESCGLGRRRAERGGGDALCTGGWNTSKPTPIGNERFDIYAELDDTNPSNTRYLHGDEFDQTFAQVDIGAANASERVL